MTTPTPRTDEVGSEDSQGSHLDFLAMRKLAAQLERELAAAQERIRELEEWNRKMVEKAASGGVLDGYRELGVKLAAAEEWREAVLNELIVAHIYTREHDANPRKAVQDAITWNCQVALDPAVSSDARALIAQERERAERAEKRSRAMRELAIDAWYCATEKMEPAFWDKTKSAIDAAIAEGKK